MFDGEDVQRGQRSVGEVRRWGESEGKMEESETEPWMRLFDGWILDARDEFAVPGGTRDTPAEQVWGTSSDAKIRTEDKYSVPTASLRASSDESNQTVALKFC
jgi:hypothetical protein